MDYGEEINGEGESNYTHSAPDNNTAWSPVVAARSKRHRTQKQKIAIRAERGGGRSLLCVVGVPAIF